MAKRKRKGTALPRVTLLAYSRRDLPRFCEAVEKLATLVDDLEVIEKRMKAKKSPAAQPFVTPVIEGTT